MSKINNILEKFFRHFGGNGFLLAKALEEHLDHHNCQIIEKSDNFGYMCTTDFEHELGYASGGNVVYPSVENLKVYKNCWESCGIVKVRVDFVETVVKGIDINGE